MRGNRAAAPHRHLHAVIGVLVNTTGERTLRRSPRDPSSSAARIASIGLRKLSAPMKARIVPVGCTKTEFFGGFNFAIYAVRGFGLSVITSPANVPMVSM
jgi:hypothetical protein